MMVKNIILVMSFAALLAALELPPLIKKAWAKEIVIYSLLLIAGSILSVIALQAIQLTSPMKLPEVMFKPLYNWMKQILQIKDE